MTLARRLFAAGSVVWIGILFGHGFLVDIVALNLQPQWFSIYPGEGLMDQLRRTIFDWGVWGKGDVFGALSGFSLWLALSFGMLGIFNLLVLRDAEPRMLAKISLFNAFYSTAFTAEARISRITPGSATVARRQAVPNPKTAPCILHRRNDRGQHHSTQLARSRRLR